MLLLVLAAPAWCEVAGGEGRGVEKREAQFFGDYGDYDYFFGGPPLPPPPPPPPRHRHRPR